MSDYRALMLEIDHVRCKIATLGLEVTDIRRQNLVVHLQVLIQRLDGEFRQDNKEG